MWIIFGIVCIISGIMVNLDLLTEKFQQMQGFKETGDKIKPIMGIIALFFGILNLIHPDYPYGSIRGSLAFIGDLIPAVLLITTGLLLANNVLNYINLSADPTTSEARKSQLNDFLEKIKLPLGIAVAVFGIIHFFAPGVNLL